MIALSCGIKISAVRHLVLSQSTRVTDRRTDGRTDRITTPKTALAYARAVKSQRYISPIRPEAPGKGFASKLA